MPTNPSIDPSVQVVIEVPRGAFVKRDAEGRIDLVSPLPTPFNYGRVTDVVGGDGEPQDAIVLGPRLPRGHTIQLPVHGVVRFVDQGERDDNWVCSARPPTLLQRRAVVAFFQLYARIKRLRDRLSLKPADSAFEGWHSVPASPNS